MTQYKPLDYSAYELATLAAPASPDSLTSPGATFLRNVRDALAEVIGYVQDSGDEFSLDSISEIAGECVPVYTHPLWLAFVDLCAYNEDISEYGGAENLTDEAKIALYVIAERLCYALLDEWETDNESEDDDE